MELGWRRYYESGILSARVQFGSPLTGPWSTPLAKTIGKPPIRQTRAIGSSVGRLRLGCDTITVHGTGKEFDGCQLVKA